MAEDFIASENGSIKISEEVITRISSISAREVEGVAALCAGGSSIGDFLGKKNQNKIKGVRAEIGENSTEVDIHIVVRFGVKIGEVARKVQESVKFALESYVGLDNVLINVFVDAVDIEKAIPMVAKEAAEDETVEEETAGPEAE